LKKLNEHDLQKAAFYLLSDPARIWNSTDGERLQVLSPGRHNVHEGPDFREVAILVNGLVCVGDAELHRKSSEWLIHNHHEDNRYSNTILHIVTDCDNPNLGLRTLIVDSNEILNAFESIGKAKIPKFELDSVEELQHFALIRLMRKTADARKLFNSDGLIKGFREINFQFLRRYNNKRRRPVYTEYDLSVLLDKIIISSQYDFLEKIQANQSFEIAGELYNLLKNKVSTEGVNLRREIILNCLLPMAMAIAKEEARIDLFLWYWSTPAMQSYGILKRKFPEFEQKFLWQQQGMLEYLKDYGRKPQAVGEDYSDYGFASVLDFYKIGK
jgi:hypothetical protein